MSRSSMLFCGASLLLSLLLSAVLFPFVTLTEEQLRASKRVTPAYEMGEVEMGEFGAIPVQELVDYYVENPPPEPAAGEVVERRVRFQGC